MGAHERDQALPAIDGLLAATALSHGLTLVIPNDRDVAGLGAMVLNPFKGAEDCRSSQRKYRQVPGLLSGAVDTSAGVVLTHPLPGGFVAPTRDSEAGGCQTVISNSDLTGRNDRMLARAVHRGGIPGSTQSNQEAQGKNRGKNRAHDGRFQSSAARYVFGSAVDHPKLRVLHDRSIRRDNFVMPDHPTWFR
jgi:hypothetical protein